MRTQKVKPGEILNALIPDRWWVKASGMALIDRTHYERIGGGTGSIHIIPPPGPQREMGFWVNPPTNCYTQLKTSNTIWIRPRRFSMVENKLLKKVCQSLKVDFREVFITMKRKEEDIAKRTVRAGVIVHIRDACAVLHKYRPNLLAWMREEIYSNDDH